MTQTNHTLDDLDQTLIAELRIEPRLAYATLGTRMGVTGMTAATRLQRLRQANLIRFQVRPNLEAFGLSTQILGMMQVDTDALASCTDALSTSPNVLRVDHIAGEYDVAFLAAFSSEAAIGSFVREMRTIPGVRRLVLHHELERIKDEDGWAAVFDDGRGDEVEQLDEVAPGVEVPDELRSYLSVAANWSRAVAEADAEVLRRFSDPDIVFTVVPPVRGAGRYAGLDEVVRAANRNELRGFWQRVLSVSTGPEPFTMVVDLIGTAEQKDGRVRSRFTRLAFEFSAPDRIKRAVNLGQLDLADIEEADELVSGRVK